jgi:hypothetical protein
LEPISAILFHGSTQKVSERSEAYVVFVLLILAAGRFISRNMVCIEYCVYFCTVIFNYTVVGHNQNVSEISTV